MANKTMHHAVIGSDTYEIVDEQARTTDATLSVSGKAADAKATGDAIREGAHPFLTAGQLLSTHETTDNTPYNYRVVEQESTLEYGEIVGGTVAFNQAAKEFASANWITESGVTASYADGVVTVSTTITGNGILSDSMTVTKDHVYLVGVTAKCSAAISLRFGLGSVILTDGSFPTSSYINAASIKKCTATVTNRLALFGASATYTDLMAKDALFIDLTQMLGTTLADYIYGLESATAGSGVTWLRKHFPKMFQYHAYDAGSLQSVEGLSHHVTVGKNLLDKGQTVSDAFINANGTTSTYSGWSRSNYIRIGGDKVTISGVGTSGYSACHAFYAEDYTFISVINSGSVTANIPSNAKYIRISIRAENLNTAQVELGSTATAYEPYSGHTYPLDDSLTLRGIYKLDSANKLYADGDVYKPDGTVVRRYGIVDLGTLTWSATSASRWSASLANVKGVATGDIAANIISDTYDVYPNNELYSNGKNGIAVHPDNSLMARNGSTTVKPSGYLVYELATPTTETADPYTNPQIVAPGGTEEYISTSVVPVGHESSYPDDLRTKLDDLPRNLSMIAPIENGNTASQAYAVGKYFMHNNQFCKAKTAIASGATLTLNTNYEVTTVADELYSALH